MCGIAGLLGGDPPDLRARAEAMTKALRHRGPDGQGVWIDQQAGVGLGHARLAIRDLTPSGDQPMISACQRFVIVYNGELYNSTEMKAALPGLDWRGTSDTEVLLEQCAAFGVLKALEASNGMFAFALWDRERRELTLSRDRFGIKPLYWAQACGVFWFGSELKALTSDPAFPRELDRSALDAFVGLSYVPAPLAIWKAARKLEPGSMLTVKAGSDPVVSRWWDAENAIRKGLALQGCRTSGDLTDEADALLQDAVRRQTVSDVPIGVFLSGGIDSSLVASCLAPQAGQGLDSFTARFSETAYDEGESARAIADHLGLRHHEQRLTAQDALALVPELARIYDEPFADSSQIPTLLISRFARQTVKVVLSGDGGDEIFAGYNRHRFAALDWPRLSATPLPLRRALAAGVGILPMDVWNVAGRFLGQSLLAEKMQKLSAILPLAGLAEIHDRLARQGLEESESPLALDESCPYLGASARPGISDLHPLDQMQLLDIQNYLPGDVLAKVDRASMAMGLEVRVPLLDHRLVELAFSVRPADRFQDGQGKALLRQILGRHLPPRLFEGRPKQGFAVPIDDWLRGPLKDWAADLLGRVKTNGLFDAKRVEGWWLDHQSAKRKRHHALWNLLMFQAWLQEQ
ncbi:MAG: asparagine synthase (glutamine-hydrolyzing) [Alphaproteobacteria bacterium]|nr:asparagine synthase (glutamine-hydrolyzing) [Alphaproteobacteria bacterium]